MDNLRVLVVDDEPLMRIGVSRILKGFEVDFPDIDVHTGFDILQAPSGEEALEIIEQEKPDIVFLDQKLPGMSGLEVLEKLKKVKETMLTVMFTAFATLDMAVTATKRGAHDFLAKPFTPIELKSTVRNAARNIIFRKEAKRLAEEKRKMRFEFVSVLSHELKAPLAAIEGYLHIIKDKSAGDDEVAYEKMLDRSLVRLEGMRKLIFDLLDLTRIESGEKARKLEAIDIIEIVKKVEETFAGTAAERNITINTDYPEKLVFLAEENEMEIILNNLVSNAIKYNRENGEVSIKLATSPTKLTIVVSDTGIGISDKEQKRIFGEFVRVKNKETRHILGSGLGLSTVKKLTRLYGGQVDLESKEGLGTTMTICLPRK